MTDVPGRTLYDQIADDLRSQIAAGTLQIGDPIPSTAVLQERYGYSSTVVRKAVEVLRNEGLVRGQPGKAVFVNATPDGVDAERVTVEALNEQVRALSAEVRELSEHVAASSKWQELSTQVAELRGLIEQLYSRLGHSYPGDNPEFSSTPQRRARSS